LFTERLAGLGYAAATVRSQLTLLGHLDECRTTPFHIVVAE